MTILSKRVQDSVSSCVRALALMALRIALCGLAACSSSTPTNSANLPASESSLPQPALTAPAAAQEAPTRVAQYTFNPLAPKLGLDFHQSPLPAMGTTYFGKPGRNDPAFTDLVRIMRPGAFFRWDLDWSAAEPESGRYDWKALDDHIADTASHNTSLLITLRGWNRAHGGVMHEAGPWLDDFVGFARAVATHIGDRDNVQYEIWPAPNVAATGLSPTAFADLVARSAAAIKAVSPHCLVFSGAAASLDPTWRQAVLGEFAAHGMPKIDGFGIDPGDTGTPEQADTLLNAAQADVKATLGPNIPVVVSKWSFPTSNAMLNRGNTSVRAGSFLARQWLALWRLGISHGLLYPSDGGGISILGDATISRAQEVFSLYADGDEPRLEGELADVPDGWRIAWKRTHFIDAFFFWNPSFNAKPLEVRVPVGSVYIDHSGRASIKTVTRVQLDYTEVNGYYVFQVPSENTPTIIVSSNKDGRF